MKTTRALAAVMAAGVLVLSGCRMAPQGCWSPPEDEPFKVWYIGHGKPQGPYIVSRGWFGDFDEWPGDKLRRGEGKTMREAFEDAGELPQ